MVWRFLYVVNSVVVCCGMPLTVMQRSFLPDKARFCAFAALYQYQRYRTALCVTHQAKPFGLQFGLGSAGEYFSKTLRFMYQIEISAEFQSLRSALHEGLQRAGFFVPC